MDRQATGQMLCKYIPPLNLRLFVPLFLLGAVLVVVIARYSMLYAITTNGEALYTLGPDKSAPPGQLLHHCFTVLVQRSASPGILGFCPLPHSCSIHPKHHTPCRKHVLMLGNIWMIAVVIALPNDVTEECGAV